MRRVGSTPQQRGSMTGETCPDVIELDTDDLVRLGSTPQQRGSTTGQTCPDVLENPQGNYLVIGKRVSRDPKTQAALTDIGASIGEGEDVVWVPRKCIIDAAREILRNEDIN